jgi:PAS domain S-box-containing protein
MKTSTVPAMNLSLISAGAAPRLFAMLAVAAAMVALLEAASGVARPFDIWRCLALGLVFCALALAVHGERLGVIAAQRVGVFAFALYTLSSLQQAWFADTAVPVDPYAVASTSAWLLLLNVLLFLCVPRAWAAAAAMALAGLAALVPWWSTASADPGLRVLALNVLLAQGVLCAVLYGVATQVLRLANLGRAAGLDGSAPTVQSVNQLVFSREAALSRLLRQSERAHRTASLREAELRTMLDAFPGVVLRIESNGVLSYCNERAAALLGTASAELEGRHASALLRDEGYERHSARNLQIQASGLPLSFETSFRHPDGTLSELLMTQFCVATGASERSTSYQIGVDIGERKRAEAALQQAKADAERANWAKSRFMSSMSHELRTPLNAVLGLAQMMRVQGPQSSAQQQLHLRTIADAGKDLLALVDETLDLSRIDAGDMRVSCQPFNLAEMVAVVRSSVAAMAQAQGVTLAPAPSARDLWVRADPMRTRQVLLNLLSNAIKYNRRGGGVAVRLVRRGGDAQLVVQDTGLGMTPAQQAQLFQPFNRLGAERGGVPGTGIGLSIAHGLVALMGGRMDVRSQPGVGSEFMVWLPLADAPVEPASLPAPSDFGALDEEPGLQGSLLYVEDNEVNVLVFQACLARRPGVRLHVARSGAEALALAARERVDLVVLDLNLPDQSGLELAHALRRCERTADVPLVLLTADATLQTAQRAHAHGIRRVWHKPFDAARLLRDVDELLKVAVAA